MIQIAVIAAVFAVAGGVVAVAARNRRILSLGLLLAMVAAPMASSPEPSALALAFRFVGALLAAYVLYAAAQAQSVESEGSAIGPMAEAALAVAAFACGWYVAPVKPISGPLAAQAAGLAMIALAIVPLSGRNVLRAGTGVAVLTVGVFLLIQAWAGPVPVLAQIAETALLIGIAGATSLLISPLERPEQAADEATESVPGGRDEEAGEPFGALTKPEWTPAPAGDPGDPGDRGDAGEAALSADAGEPAPTLASSPKPVAPRTSRAAKSGSAASSAKGKTKPAAKAPAAPVPLPMPGATRTRGLRPREPRQ
jgi:hypothetical protein